MAGLDDTFRPASPAPNASLLLCPSCAKQLENEPNFCPACGADLRGGGTPSLAGPSKDTLIDKRYRVVEKLGEGGMGAVYKVEHVRMGKLAALKVMRPDFALDRSLKARFLQEAHVVAKLSHPNTVQVFDTGELDDGSLFITMEFVPGKDLAWHLKAHGAMPETKVVSIGLQLLASLQEAHEAGIVHRDIKPANVMLVRRKKGLDEQVKLLDFGIAKLQEADGRRSASYDFVGTPAYMSPEQIRGENVDARSDLYATGALLLELLTGKQLFTGETPAAIIKLQLEAPVPKLADLAPIVILPAFEAVLRRALEKDANNRFKDADEMRLALEGVRKALGAATADFTPMPAELADKMLSREDFEGFERRLRLQRTLFPVAVLLSLTAIGLGAWRTAEHVAPPSSFTAEQEPNDQTGKATPILLNTAVSGTVGARPAGENDRDLFLVQVPEGRAAVTVNGVDDLNLTVELSQLEKSGEGEKLRRKLFLDDVGLGQTERVEGLQVSAGPLYVRVEEQAYCTEQPRPSRERSLVPYTVKVVSLPASDDAEQEPNDTPTTAQAVPMTKAVRAMMGARVDDLERKQTLRPDAPFSTIDWFKVSGPASETIYAVLIPPEHGALAVHDGAVLDTWRTKASQATAKQGPPPFPAAVLVKGEPKLLKLESGELRRFRVTPHDDTQPGEPYVVAAASAGPNGLAGLLDALSVLAKAGKTREHQALLELALKTFESSPDVAQLKALQP